MSTQQEVFYQDLTPKSPSPLMLKVFLGLTAVCLVLASIEVIQDLLQKELSFHSFSPLFSGLSALGIIWIQWRTKHPAPGSYFVRIYPTYLEHQGAHSAELGQVNFAEISQCYLEWNRIDLKVDGKPWVHIQARGPRQAKLIHAQIHSLMQQAAPATA